MKESTIFYPARGTTKMEAQPEGNRTQYGWTSTFCGLQLHAGDHTYHKRGGLYSAFLFDKIDYRYDGLLKSLGINDVPALGCLIGRLYGQDDELIRFRITEEDPTHIVVCYDCRDVKLDEVSVPMLPTIISPVLIPIRVNISLGISPASMWRLLNSDSLCFILMADLIALYA